MFGRIQADILDRVMTTRLFFTAATTLNVPRASGTAKGLVFVQLYAVYEYTVRESVSSAFAAATGHAMPTNQLWREMIALALDADFMAISDLKRRGSWARRLQLLERSESAAPAVFDQLEFPDDGSHYRPAQLETLWMLLGIKQPVVSEPKHRGRINELVQHRNAIAHGRDTADTIGGRFSDADIQERINDLQGICLHILQTIEDHCSGTAGFCTKN